MKIRMYEENHFDDNITFDVRFIPVIKLSEDLDLDHETSEFTNFMVNLGLYFENNDYVLVKRYDNGKHGSERSLYWEYKKVEKDIVLRAFIKVRVSSHQLGKDNYSNTVKSIKMGARNIAKKDYNQTKGYQTTFINVNGHLFNEFQEALDYVESELDKFEVNKMTIQESPYIYTGGVVPKKIKSRISKVVIADEVTRIDKDAFNGCIELSEIKIPKNVSIIDSNAFKECFMLDELVLPENVRIIYTSAFNNCPYLSSLSIYNNDINIKDGAFVDCKRLIIYCHKDSSAERYCIENNISYEIIK